MILACCLKRNHFLLLYDHISPYTQACALLARVARLQRRNSQVAASQRHSKSTTQCAVAWLRKLWMEVSYSIATGSCSQARQARAGRVSGINREASQLRRTKPFLCKAVLNQSWLYSELRPDFTTPQSIPLVIPALLRPSLATLALAQVCALLPH
jgi:hypothetical protein